MFIIYLPTAVDFMLPEKMNNYQSNSHEILTEKGVKHLNQSNPLEANHRPITPNVVNISFTLDKMRNYINDIFMSHGCVK